MVLSLKRWKSRSSPGIVAGAQTTRIKQEPIHKRLPAPTKGDQRPPPGTVAGWSSPVARQAHNLKVTGSNPVPATILICKALTEASAGAFCCTSSAHSSSMAASSPHRWTTSSPLSGVSSTASMSARMRSNHWLRGASSSKSVRQLKRLACPTACPPV